MTNPATITVDRLPLARAMALANICVERRNVIPILGTLRAVANGALAFEGTDLDTFSRACVPYSGDHCSFILPDAHRLVSAINFAGGQSVSFATAEDAPIVVKSGELTSEICAQAASDHPGAETVALETFGADISATELAQLRRLVSAISRKETRYYLNGVAMWHLADWTWRFASTDGHRLTYVDIPLPGAVGDMGGAVTIIPARFIRLALVHFARCKDAIRLSFGTRVNRNHPPETNLELATATGPCRFQLRGMIDGVDFTLATKLVDGNYPDVMRVVPKDARFGAIVARADLVRAIRATSSMAQERTRAIKLVFTRGTARISNASPGFASSGFTIPAEFNHDETCETGVNAAYMLDMLSALQGDEVALAIESASAPILLTNPADTAFCGVLMPMRV